jgi:hypothetical protein
LIAAAFALVVRAVYLFRTQNFWDAHLEAALEVVFAVVFFASGLWQVTRGDLGSFTPDEAARVFVMGLGGIVGFLVWVSSLLFVFYPAPPERKNLWQETVFGGTEAWQGPEGWRMWVVLLVNLAGLAITFVSLLAVVSLERQRPVLRRIVYGYNVAVSCLMLFAILLVLNVLCYIYVPAVSDWTAGGLYTLSSQSIKVLDNLKRPVKVYVFISSQGDPIFGEVNTLLDNCKRVNPAIQTTYLLRDRHAREVAELAKKYQILDPLGILVVFGDDADEAHQFIKWDDLAEASSMRRDGSFVFKGEDQFITAVDYLAKGKKKVVVYFTQGHDELDINDLDSRKMDAGAGKLRERLAKANYEVKGLLLDPLVKSDKSNVVSSAKVPEDADVVVIAGPKLPFEDHAVQALRDYLKGKKGKLFVALDVVARDGKMAKLGLEPLLAEYHVETTDERVLTLVGREPEQVFVTVNAELAETNPVANALSGEVLWMVNARVVQPKRPSDDPAERGQDAEAKTLFVAFNRVLRSSDLTTSPVDQIDKLGKLPAEELAAKISRTIPVGVAVTTAGPPDFRDPHAMMRGRRERKSKMVVLGDATWFGNAVIGSREGHVFFAIFTSTINWLYDEERPVVGIPPKERETYSMASNTNVYRLYYLPFLLMFVGIVGLGTGVWVVRRK